MLIKFYKIDVKTKRVQNASQKLRVLFKIVRVMGVYENDSYSANMSAFDLSLTQNKDPTTGRLT